jgi:hypothetical protein
MEGSALDEIDLTRIDAVCAVSSMRLTGDRGAQAWNRTGFGNLTNQWLCLVPLIDSFARLSSSARSSTRRLFLDQSGRILGMTVAYWMVSNDCRAARPQARKKMRPALILHGSQLSMMARVS